MTARGPGSRRLPHAVVVSGAPDLGPVLELLCRLAPLRTVRLRHGAPGLERHPLTPRDVLVLDCSSGSGHETVSCLRTLPPSLRSTVLFVHPRPSAAAQLAEVVRPGGHVRWVPPDFSFLTELEWLRVHLASPRTTPVPDHRDALSSRERQVHELLSAGATHVEVAEQLGLAAGTVKTYASRARQKLHHPPVGA